MSVISTKRQVPTSDGCLACAEPEAEDDTRSARTAAVHRPAIAEREVSDMGFSLPTCPVSRTRECPVTAFEHRGAQRFSSTTENKKHQRCLGAPIQPQLTFLRAPLCASCFRLFRDLRYPWSLG